MRVLLTFLGALTISLLTMVMYWVAYGRNHAINLQPLYYPIMASFVAVSFIVGGFLGWILSPAFISSDNMYPRQFGLKCIWGGSSVIVTIICVALLCDFNLMLSNPRIFISKWLTLLIWPPCVEAILTVAWGVWLIKFRNLAR